MGPQALEEAGRTLPQSLQGERGPAHTWSLDCGLQNRERIYDCSPAAQRVSSVMAAQDTQAPARGRLILFRKP